MCVSFHAVVTPPPDTPTTAPTGTAAATDAATMQPAAIQ